MPKSKCIVTFAFACLPLAACSPNTPTEPTPPVSTATPISRAPALNLPAGLYRLTLRSSSASFMPGTAACAPEGGLPTDKVVQTEIRLVPEDGGFSGRATAASETLVIRLRDAGPNYIGSRNVLGSIAGVALARTGTARAFEAMATLESLGGNGGSEVSPEATTAGLSFPGPIRFIETAGGVATCSSASAFLELVSRAASSP